MELWLTHERDEIWIIHAQAWRHASRSPIIHGIPVHAANETFEANDPLDTAPPHMYWYRQRCFALI